MKKIQKKRYGILLILWLIGLWKVWTGDSDGTVVFLNEYHSERSLAAGKSSSEIRKEIEEKNAEQKSAEAEKRQLEKDIASIEEKKGNVAAYIEELDKKSNDLAQRILRNQDNIKKLKKEIKKLRKEKKEASGQKKKQYETMKKRIKYMYEHGNTDYLELILGADSLSEFFNRAEYVSKVTEFDRNLLKNYQKLCRVIAESEKKIEKKVAGLEETRESLKVEQASVVTLVEKKRDQVARYQNLLDAKSDTLGDTEVLLAAQENELEKLFEAERAASEREEAERKAAAARAAAKKAAEEKAAAERAAAQEAARAAEQKKEGEKLQSTKPPATKRPETTTKPTAAPTEAPTEAPAGTASGGYVWPLAAGGRISSYFGPRNAPTEGASTYHKGIDISVPVGTAVLAAKGGTVITATYSASAGNYVAISHGGGVYTYYMHCSSLSVSVGQSVNAGQQIALSGNSGISTGPHLHFGMFMDGNYVNPLNYVG